MDCSTKTPPPKGNREMGRRLLPGESGLNVALVQAVLVELLEHQHQSGLAAELRMGQAVLDALFGGSFSAFGARSTTHHSYRALAQSDDLPMSHSRLRSAILLVDHVRKLPDALVESLNLSQHRALLPITDPERKVSLAVHAVQNKLGTRRLQALVSADLDRRYGGRKPGRRRLPAHVRRARRILTILRDLPPKPGARRDLHEHLSPRELRTLREGLVAMMGSLGDAGTSIQASSGLQRVSRSRTALPPAAMPTSPPTATTAIGTSTPAPRRSSATA